MGGPVLSPRPKSVFVTGSSRGIGLELVRSYAADGWRVFASCRDPADAGELRALASAQASVEILALDVSDAEQIERLATALSDEPLDLLVNNAGVYGRKALPLDQVDAVEWASVFAVNAIAPFLVTRALLPCLERGRDRIVAMLSSKVGSMTENTSGGNFAYRTSKAALNQVVKTLSIDLAERGIISVALHPGWVQTGMGGPNALISASESVAGLRRVIAGLGRADSGRFLAYDGASIPW